MKKLILLSFLLSSPVVLANNFSSKLADAALERTKAMIIYDGSYYKLDYPNGDVPSHIGVCTDVVIRTYRAVNIDLQALVHNDMKRYFSAYPSKRIWGLTRADSNIDHRRVPNLQTFFKRHGEVLPITDSGASYHAGDIVTWMLPGNLPHIGIVSDKTSDDNQRPLIIHNIGLGPMLEDMLFDYTITGHYKYQPDTATATINH